MVLSRPLLEMGRRNLVSKRYMLPTLKQTSPTIWTLRPAVLERGKSHSFNTVERTELLTGVKRRFR